MECQVRELPTDFVTNQQINKSLLANKTKIRHYKTFSFVYIVDLKCVLMSN
jgi:hypothetical protein